MIAAIILAAGESRRMGRLKPLIHINGQTFLHTIYNELMNSGIADIHVIVGHQAEKIKTECGFDADFVFNQNYKDGQFSSLQAGIASLSPACDAVVVCLGDQPQVKAAWIKSLMTQFNHSKTAIIRPSFKGRSGHPVVYSSKIFKDILNLPATATAKHIMEKYTNETIFVDIDTDAILYDADTPDDLQSIKKYFIL